MKCKDIEVGMRFGRLMIVELLVEVRIEKRKCKSTKVKTRFAKCICDCGGSRKARLYDLLMGQTKSCGCLKRKITDYNSILGTKINQLFVVGPIITKKNNGLEICCRCSCGKEKYIDYYKVRSGIIKSCGCAISNVLKKRNFKHGMTNTSEYNIWCKMIARCNNPKDGAFHDYGGRGISVSPDWIGDGGFMNFLDCLGLRPGKKFSLDRIDVNGNYEPGNVRWATASQQAKNKRKYRAIENFSDNEFLIEAKRRGFEVIT